MSHEVAQQLSSEVQLDTVPPQRGIIAPTPEAVAELLCPPEDMMLQQYRKEKAQILRVRKLAIPSIRKLH